MGTGARLRSGARQLIGTCVASSQFSASKVTVGSPGTVANYVIKDGQTTVGGLFVGTQAGSDWDQTWWRTDSASAFDFDPTASPTLELHFQVGTPSFASAHQAVDAAG